MTRSGTRTKFFRTQAARSLLTETGTTSIHEAIPRYVAEVRQKALGRGLSGTRTRPYDPGALAQVLGVSEVRRKALDCDGRIVSGFAGLAIELNKQENDQSQRVRFTFAHEVGHLILWKCAGAVRTSATRKHGTSSEIERLCDMLAAEILAPEFDLRSMFRVEMTARPPAAETIRRVAERFRTSLHFAAVRLRAFLNVKFGAGLANVTGEYWDWHFGIGTPDSLLEVLKRSLTIPQETQRREYFDDTRRRPLPFDVVKIGSDRILVVVPA